MRTVDILHSTFIVLIFVMLYIINVYSVGFKHIEDNWAKYRCNPLVMPISSMFGVSPKENMMYCVQNMQSVFLGDLLQPVYFVMRGVSSFGGVIGDSLNSVRKAFSAFRIMSLGSMFNVFGVFINLMIETQKMVIKVKDTMGKTAGVIGTTAYLLDGSVKTAQSTWNGPIGESVRVVGKLIK